jgi:hypothetical protein
MSETKIVKVDVVETFEDFTLVYVDGELQDYGITETWSIFDLAMHLKGKPCLITFYDVLDQFRDEIFGCDEKRLKNFRAIANKVFKSPE